MGPVAGGLVVDDRLRIGLSEGDAKRTPGFRKDALPEGFDRK